jgi:hypothetical protein
MAVLARTQIIPTYVSTLRQVLGYYIGYINNVNADTAENWYELIKNDSAVAHAIHFLSLVVAGEKVEIKCKDEILRKMIEFGLSEIKDFIHVRKSLTYSAILFGLGVMKKEWSKKYWLGLEWDIPCDIREIDRRRLRLEQYKDDRTRYYWTVWSPKYNAYVVLEDRSIIPTAEYAVQDYIWYIHEYEEMNPYFRGFGEILFPLCYMKSKIIQYWADLCESWAKPFLTVMIDAAKASFNAALGSGLATAQERINEIFDAFEKARSRHMVVMDSSDKMEYHERGSAGNNIIKDLLGYIDEKIQLLILGAQLTTQTEGTGSYALGQIHRGATQSIIQYNRIRLCEVLLQELVMDFLWKNRLNLFIAGVEKFPSLHDIKLQIQVESEEIRKDTVEDGVAAGQKLGSQI